jgi:hypothetical protein
LEAKGIRLALHAEVQTQDAPAARPMDRLVSMLSGDLAEVERLLAERAASPVATIPDLSSYLISAGGKRLRPVLTLAAARAVGGRGGEPVWKLAAAVEFIHTATLLHDDVVDDSDLRRGKAAAKNDVGRLRLHSRRRLPVRARLHADRPRRNDLRDPRTFFQRVQRASSPKAKSASLPRSASVDLADSEEYMAIVEAKTAPCSKPPQKRAAQPARRRTMHAISDAMGEPMAEPSWPAPSRSLTMLLDYGGTHLGDRQIGRRRFPGRQDSPCPSSTRAKQPTPPTANSGTA